jgi:hypothetical protein
MIVCEIAGTAAIRQTGDTIWYNRRTAQRQHVHDCKQQGLRGVEQNDF